MDNEPSQPLLEDEEKRARIRLAAYRAKLFRNDGASPMATQVRLRELERKWEGAVDRLKRRQRPK